MKAQSKKSNRKIKTENKSYQVGDTVKLNKRLGNKPTPLCVEGMEGDLVLIKVGVVH